MKKTILSLVVLCASFFSFSQGTISQNWCGISQKTNEAANDPIFQSNFEQSQIIIEQEKNSIVSVPKATLRKIPIVFHILHDGGANNISREQVLDALSILNEDYRRLNDDYDFVAPVFAGMAADCEIEFVLATKAPNGNCFTGITRTYNPTAANDGTQDQVGAIRDGNDVYNGDWPGNKYLNVFVVGSLSEPGSQLVTIGYTYTPAWGGTTMGNGFHVIHNALGSIGTGGGSDLSTSTHEIGHWLNLKHTWGNGNDPGESGNCSQDDGVDDTPRCAGIQGGSCSPTNSNPLNSCSNDNNYWGFDIQDQVENYMDYAHCTRMFSEGQKQRMHNALNSGVGGRNNLWTAQNLIDTGADGTTYLCKTDFSSDRNDICNGSSIQFTDETFNEATGWNWTFEGGTPATSTDQNPLVTYTTPGLYQVSLTATDGSINDTETKASYIRVLSEPSPLPIEESFESLTTLTNIDEFTIVNTDNDHTFVLDPTVGLTGTKSVKINNFGKADNRIDELVSSSIDLSSLDTSDMMTLSFKYAYKRINFSDDDWLRLFVTNDCGETWGLRMSRHGFTLGTTFQTWPYTPSLDEDWVTVHVTNIFEEFFNDKFRYKFAFTSGEGNNMYIDDINIYKEIDSTAGIIEGEEFSDLSMYPNPASDELNVLFDINTNMQANIQIIDIAGKIIQNHSINAVAGGNVVSMNTRNLNAGIYIMKLEINGSSETRRLIIK